MQEKYIAGIYNYCDRWCERCTYTTRCQNFESSGKPSSAQLDVSNKAFWDNLSANFQHTIQLLYKAAAKQGIDLDNVMTKEEEEAYIKKKEAVRKKAKSHPIAGLCKQYRNHALPFIKNSNGMVNTARELVHHLHVGIIAEEEVVHTMATLGNCFEIIQWYLFFIEPKLQRALQGKIEGEDWEVENGFAKDSDGSAKIALIAIERSIDAWAGIYKKQPALEDDTLKALSLLSRLKQITIKEFPAAMQFKRPGFDE
jgi:hypothetical protein